MCAGPAHAENTTGAPFRIVEAAIDEIHTAFRSGRLTARQLVQGYLDRINAYDSAPRVRGESSKVGTAVARGPAKHIVPLRG
jgi:amidase